MNKYRRDVALLSDLETFDPRAFVGDSCYPQEMCDFVLALALAYNDFKNVIFASMILDEVRPNDLERPTPEVGQFGGLHLHLLRTVAGILRAVMELIEEHDRVLSHPKFAKLVRHLPVAAREAWGDVVAAAQQKPATSELAMLLVRARNKVAFHYDARELARGYSHAFLTDQKMEPYLSRGASMAQSRFYFADAAAELYLRNVVDAATTQTFFTAASPLLNQINHGLRELVTRFITMRGFGWREPAA